jgi:hypothetical protein
MANKANPIKVACAYTKLAKISALKPHPDNPKKHPASQIQFYAESLREFGFRRPVVISKGSGSIVAGHGLVEAAKLLGCTQVPVDEQLFKDDISELGYLAADNRLAELSDWDYMGLSAVVKKIEDASPAFNWPSMGMDDDFLQNLRIANFEPPKIGESSVASNSKTKHHKVEFDQKRWRYLERQFKAYTKAHEIEVEDMGDFLFFAVQQLSAK